MKAEDLRKWLDSLTDDIEFRYCGVWGAICPFSHTNISISYGDNEQTFHSVDAALEAPCIAGKSLLEICEQLEV